MKRRAFLSRSASYALSSSAVMNTLFHLKGIGTALAHEAHEITDFKALVCVFMRGGNDTNNLLVPISGPNRNFYDTARGILAVQAASALPIGAVTYQDGTNYGFHPGMPGLKSLYDAGKMAVVANVGTLVVPTTKSQYLSGAVPVPPQLFSHSDQQVQWQSSVPDQAFQTGWGGRLADMMASANALAGAQISISMTLSGLNNFQVGVTTSPYAVAPTGSIPLSGYGSGYVNALNPDGTFRNTNPGHRLKAFRDIMAMGNPHHMQNAYAGVVNRAYDADRLLTSALEGVTLTTPFPNSGLGAQLAMVARLIAAREALKQKRQIFFVVLDGFDTHDSQSGAHDALMAELDGALSAFYAATVEIGIPEEVTTFGASDFSRTLTPNKSDITAGSDHAWGTHMFALGGAVRGGDIYGTLPSLQLNGPDDVSSNNGRGRWIPTLSVDEYAATIAKWFGVHGDELASVFPNLNRFARPDIGFMT